MTTFDEQKIQQDRITPSLESYPGRGRKSPSIDGPAMPSEKARGKRVVGKKQSKLNEDLPGTPIGSGDEGEGVKSKTKQ